MQLVLQITEHLAKNVQTSIVPFLQNILMQQYWNIYASILNVGIYGFSQGERSLNLFSFQNATQSSKRKSRCVKNKYSFVFSLFLFF